MLRHILYIILCALSVSLTATAQVFQATSIPDSVWARMQGRSVPKNCTVRRDELRYLRLSYWDTEQQERIGEMVCNKKISQHLIDIFRELYNNRYTIGRMQLIDDFDADDVKSMEANNTSCFCYRNMTGGTAISKHGLGLAIDINPLYNPYVKGAKVSPPSARKYATKRQTRNDIPMKIDKTDLCYRLFIKHGFRWGGAWRSCQDYQHFEY